MMPRGISLLVGALAGTLLIGGVSGAKGTGFRFDQEQYQPGDRAIGRATVETWPGTQPEDGPFFVYLVRGTQPLWYGHLPKNWAIRVGRLQIGEAVAPNKYPVRAAFRVPKITDAHYAVWVCGRGCGGNSGFGDLVYGGIDVDTHRSQKPSSPCSNPPQGPLRST